MNKWTTNTQSKMKSMRNNMVMNDEHSVIFNLFMLWNLFAATHGIRFLAQSNNPVIKTNFHFMLEKYSLLLTLLFSQCRAMSYLAHSGINFLFEAAKWKAKKIWNKRTKVWRNFELIRQIYIQSWKDNRKKCLRH